MSSLPVRVTAPAVVMSSYENAASKFVIVTVNPAVVETGVENVGAIPASRAEPDTSVVASSAPGFEAVMVTVVEAPESSPVTVTVLPSRTTVPAAESPWRDGHDREREPSAVA